MTFLGACLAQGMGIRLGNSCGSFSQQLISVVPKALTFIRIRHGSLVSWVQCLVIPVELGVVTKLGMPAATDSQNLQYCCYWRNWAAGGGVWNSVKLFQ